jgi:hypothetical protein
MLYAVCLRLRLRLRLAVAAALAAFFGNRLSTKKESRERTFAFAKFLLLCVIAGAVACVSIEALAPPPDCWKAASSWRAATLCVLLEGTRCSYQRVSSKVTVAGSSAAGSSCQQHRNLRNQNSS